MDPLTIKMDPMVPSGSRCKFEMDPMDRLVDPLDPLEKIFFLTLSPKSST